MGLDKVTITATQCGLGRYRVFLDGRVFVFRTWYFTALAFAPLPVLPKYGVSAHASLIPRPEAGR